MLLSGLSPGTYFSVNTAGTGTGSSMPLTLGLGAWFWLQAQAGLSTMAQLQAQSTGELGIPSPCNYLTCLLLAHHNSSVPQSLQASAGCGGEVSVC